MSKHVLLILLLNHPRIVSVLSKIPWNALNLHVDTASGSKENTLGWINSNWVAVVNIIRQCITNPRVSEFCERNNLFPILYDMTQTCFPQPSHDIIDIQQIFVAAWQILYTGMLIVRPFETTFVDSLITQSHRQFQMMFFLLLLEWDCLWE